MKFKTFCEKVLNEQADVDGLMDFFNNSWEYIENDKEAIDYMSQMGIDKSKSKKLWKEFYKKGLQIQGSDLIKHDKELEKFIKSIVK